jgi:DNA-binding SARP family transcriptional activator/DNA-binding beta-propeller fold protein YncE
VDFRILGPLEVDRAGRPLALGGAQQRALLVLLILHRNRVLRTDQIIDELWGEQPPPTAVKTLQGYVSALRKSLGDDVILTRGRGYLLSLQADQVDVDRFETLVSAGRQALADDDPTAAGDRLSQALALWRGDAVSDFAHEPFAQSENARLEEARLAALEDRVDADLARGRDSALVAELESLVRQHPLRERLRAQLMLALYRSGRQADALKRYQQARRHLVDQLGIEPGPALSELERAILAHDPALRPHARAVTLDRAVARRGSRTGAIIAAAVAALTVAGIVIASSGSPRARVTEPVADARPAGQGGAIVAIDPASDRVVADLPIGRSPSDVATGAGSIWVLDANDQTISQINPQTRSVAQTFGAGAAPARLAFGDGSVWVGSSAGLPPRDRVDESFLLGTVIRIDPQTSTLPREVIKLPNRYVGSGGLLMDNPSGAGALTVGHGAVWAINPDGSVSHIDPRNGRVVATIDGVNADSLAVDPTGVWAIGGGPDRGKIFLIDARSNTITTSLTLPGSNIQAGQLTGGQLAVVGDGALWVTDAYRRTIWRVRIDGVTGRQLDLGQTSAVAVGANSVWLTNDQASTLTRIDPETLRILKVIQLPAAPESIAIDAGLVWVSVV